MSEIIVIKDPVQDSRVDNESQQEADDQGNIIARIYKHIPRVNQKCHYYGKGSYYTWRIQFQMKNMFKTTALGYNKHEGSISYLNMEFDDYLDAINYCREMGYGYIVEFPNAKYHTKKSYSDNFKWAGFPKEEEEEY